MKKFIIFSDERYRELLMVLLESLQLFSKAEVHVVCMNFKLNRHFNGVRLDEVEWDLSGVQGVGMARFDYIAKHNIHNAVLLDADCVANWNVDVLLMVLLSRNTHLAPKAIHGSFNDREKDWFNPPENYVYTNSVPMFININTVEWISSFCRWRKTLQLLFNKLHDNDPVDDEKALNYFRVLSGEKHYTSCCAPDREWFPVYMDDSKMTSEVDYYGCDVTWNLFHGEKDPVKAREMLNAIIEKGPEFVRKHPIRGACPQIKRAT